MEGGRRRRGKEPTEDQAVSQRGVIGPTQNQNIRSRVGQATTRQRDWQATLKALKQDKMHLNGPIFHSNPTHVPCAAGTVHPGICCMRVFFPRLSCLSVCLSVCWAVWVLACQHLHQLPALQ